MAKRFWALLTVLLLLTGCAAAESEADAPQVMQVHQILNGCADAYMLRCGDIVIIIDGGNATGTKGDHLLDYFRQANIPCLTAYIATHYHNDHSANMNLFLREFGDADTLVFGPSEHIHPEYDPLAAGTYHQLCDGDVVTFGDVELTCIGPDEVNSRGRNNQDSLNFIIRYGERRFLFTGDYVRGRPTLENHSADIENVDVLKFPHHGLEPLCIDRWVMRKVNPAIILLPGSSPGPALRFAEKAGFTGELYCNGDGNIVILTNGKTLNVVTQAEPDQFAF